jgi:hypothetical protein
MRTLYVEQYLAKELRLEPSIVVDVQGTVLCALIKARYSPTSLPIDLHNPPPGTTCSYVRLPLSKLAENLLDGDSAPRFNALSTASAAVHGHNSLFL